MVAIDGQDDTERFGGGSETGESRYTRPLLHVALSRRYRRLSAT
jgi:hypothetical protein